MVTRTFTSTPWTSWLELRKTSLLIRVCAPKSSACRGRSPASLPWASTIACPNGTTCTKWISNTGKRVLVEKNTQEFAGYNLDFDLKPRIASKNDAEGTELLRRVGDKWVSMLRIGQEDSLTSGLIGIEFSGKTALLQSSVGRDKAALERVDLATGKTTLIAESKQADLEDVWLEPKSFKPQAYVVNYLKPEITALDPAIKKDVDFLDQGARRRIRRRQSHAGRHVLVGDHGRCPGSRVHLHL